MNSASLASPASGAGGQQQYPHSPSVDGQAGPGVQAGSGERGMGTNVAMSMLQSSMGGGKHNNGGYGGGGVSFFPLPRADLGEKGADADCIGVWGTLWWWWRRSGRYGR